MEAKQDLIELATALGQALGASPEVQAYQQAAQEALADGQASGLKARLEEMYDELVQRQSAGEVLAGGEIDAYYNLENEVQAHPALAKQVQALERVKELFTETHNLLTNELGLSLHDLIK